MATKTGKKSRSSVRQSVNVDEQKKEFDDLIQQLFKVADANKSGTVRFGEFLVHHEKFMDAATSLPSTDYNETESNFRRMDKDHSGCLNEEEFYSYMESLIAVLGGRNFRLICQELLRKDQERRLAEEEFDFRHSERLVEQARIANYYLPEMQEDAINFLEQKANPNHVDSSGSHCLIYAASKSSPSFISRLIEFRASPMLANLEGDCAAFKAARARNLDTLAVLLLRNPPAEAEAKKTEEEEKEVPDAPTEAEELEKLSRDLVRDMSSLNEAGIHKLVARRADINYRDDSGWTPLTSAIFFGDVSRVKALLNVKKDGWKVQRLRIDQFNGKGRAALHIAAKKGHAEALSLLLKARGNADGQDIDGWTPLHHAAFNGKSEVVNTLLESQADLLMQGRAGLTPYQVTRLPTCSAALSEESMKVLKPGEGIDFAKKILPILKDEELNIGEKLHQLLDLPGVNQRFPNLRLHEQCFDPRLGPNKVRLRRLWELLALPLIKRLCHGETDLKPSQSNNPSDRAQRATEISSRQQEQQKAVVEWLKATKGLKPSPDWKFENRSEYEDDLRTVVALELGNFEKEMDQLYQAALQQEGGAELAELPQEEVVRSDIQSQISVHPIPLWVEDMDPAGAFEALRLVGAYDLGKDDDDAMLTFVELLTLEQDFSTGCEFWRNAYRLWLSEYAKAADREFHKCVSGVIERFESFYGHDRTMTAVYQPGPVKTYDQMKAKEFELGQSSHETYQERTIASKILDVVRGSITVGIPQAALVLLNDFFRPLEGKLELVRVENGFSSKTRTSNGQRNLVLNLEYDGGVVTGRCGRPGSSLRLTLIGEVQINLASFSEAQQRRQVLHDCSRGAYDWPPELPPSRGSDAPPSRGSSAQPPG